jgi:hypothetical protein
LASIVSDPLALLDLLTKHEFLDGTIGAVDICSTCCVSWLVRKDGFESVVYFNLYDNGPSIAYVILSSMPIA